jgi:hypothetical protein
MVVSWRVQVALDLDARTCGNCLNLFDPADDLKRHVLILPENLRARSVVASSQVDDAAGGEQADIRLLAPERQ